MSKTETPYHFVSDENFDQAKMPENSKPISLMDGKVLADTIVNVRFSDAEKATFARVIRQFNNLYWEMGIQTWKMTYWRGVNVFKAPTDLWLYQELLQAVLPDVIIETGTHCGGSSLWMRDCLNLIKPEARIITIDIKDQLHDKVREEAKKYINNEWVFIHGSSVSEEVFNEVVSYIRPEDKVMVSLDSDHSYEHVKKELSMYPSLVSVGSALVVEDTNNTQSVLDATEEWYFDNRKKFKKDYMCEKFMLTFNRDGWFERIG